MDISSVSMLGVVISTHLGEVVIISTVVAFHISSLGIRGDGYKYVLIGAHQASEGACVYYRQ